MNKYTIDLEDKIVEIGVGTKYKSDVVYEKVSSKISHKYSTYTEYVKCNVNQTFNNLKQKYDMMFETEYYNNE